MSKTRREALREREKHMEQPDSTPIEIPGKGERPLSLRDEMRRFVREELSKQAEELNAGSFEDEDDFSEDNPEVDMLSKYTVLDLKPEDGQQSESLEGAPTQEDLLNANDNHSAPAPLENDLGGEAAEAEGATPSDVARSA